MTDKPNDIILHVAEVYGFSVFYHEPLDKWIITSKSRSGAELYWDSTYTEKDFFEEIASFFREDGKESVYPF
jgi:hypothetical protein